MSTTTPPAPAASPAPTRRRYTRHQIDERRIGVWEMVTCGSSVAEIAKKFVVCEKTIERDIRWWEQRLGVGTEELRDPKKAAIDVGMTAKRLMKIAEDAYVEYLAANNGAFKARFLTASMQAVVLRHKILADAGFLPKVGHEKESAPSVNISFEARFGKDAIESVFDDPKSRRRVLEAAFGIFKSGMSGQDIAGLPLNPDEIEAVADPSEPGED